MISATLDDNQVKLATAKLIKDVPGMAKKSALSIGFEIMRLSQMEVPHDKGSLQNSGNVEEIGDDVVVGYHEPYAARLHEHPEYHFQKGRKGKYLEDPIVRNQKVLGIQFASNFGGQITHG